MPERHLTVAGSNVEVAAARNLGLARVSAVSPAGLAQGGLGEKPGACKTRVQLSQKRARTRGWLLRPSIHDSWHLHPERQFVLCLKTLVRNSYGYGFGN